MDDQIRQYEQIADQIDQESMHVIQRQKAQIKNIQNHLTLSQARLSVLEQQKVSDQQTIDIQGRTLSEQLTKNQQLQAEAARLQAVAFNNQIQAQQVPLLQAQLNDLANQNRAVVQDAVQLHIDKETLQTQARAFLAQKQQLIQAMSLQERTLADKDKDLQALALKCRGLFDDNKALAQRCQEHRYAWQEAVGSCRKLLKDALQTQNQYNRVSNDKQWLAYQLSRCLDQNLLIARQLGANAVCRKMRALCKAIRFIRLLHGAVKNGIVNGRSPAFHKSFSCGLRKIDKVPDQELTGLSRAQDPLKYLNITSTIPKLKNPITAIPRDQLEDIQTLQKMDQRFGTNRISHLLQKAIEAGQERKEFSLEAKNGYSQKEHLQKRTRDMEIQVQRLQSELMKEIAEKEKLSEQLINEQKTVTNQNEQLTDLHTKLAHMEREQTRELQDVKEKLRVAEMETMKAQAQVTHLTSALDQKQREHLRLMRDFERANVRVRTQMDHVQDARAILGQVAGEQALAEKRRRLSALQEKARAASVVM